MNRRQFLKSSAVATATGLATLVAFKAKSTGSGGPPPNYLFVQQTGSYTTLNYGTTTMNLPSGLDAQTQANIMAAASALAMNQTVDVPTAGITPTPLALASADYYFSVNPPPGWPGAGAPVPQFWAAVAVVVVVLVVAGYIIYKLCKMASNLIPAPPTNSPD